MDGGGLHDIDRLVVAAEVEIHGQRVGVRPERSGWKPDDVRALDAGSRWPQANGVNVLSVQADVGRGAATSRRAGVLELEQQWNRRSGTEKEIRRQPEIDVYRPGALKPQAVGARVHADRRGLVGREP